MLDAPAAAAPPVADTTTTALVKVDAPEPRYWAAAKETAFGTKLQSRLDLCHTELVASMHLRLVGLAYTHFFGKDVEGVGADAAQVTRSGEQGEVGELRVPNSRALANGVLNIVTGPKLAWQPVATTNDFNSRAAVITAANALEYYWKEKNVEAAGISVALEAIIFGEGFLFTPWDQFAGDDVAALNGAMVKQGDIRYRGVHTWDVLRDPNYKSWEELPWYAFITYENKFDVAAEYPKTPESLILSKTPSLTHWTPFRWSTAESDTIPVIHFFHKRTPALQAGRQTKMLEGGVILEDGPLHKSYHQVLPLHRMSSGEYIGTPFPYAAYWSALGVQQMSDGVHTALSTNITSTATGLISAETGTDLQQDQISGGPKIVYRKVGSKPPEVVPLQIAQPESFKYLQVCRQEAQQLVGLNGVSLGQPDSASMSGAMAALLSSMSIQANSVVQNKWVQFCAEIGTGTLHHIQTRMSQPRMIALSGRGRSALVKALQLSGGAVMGVQRVHVDIGNPLQQTAAGRYELAQLNLKAAQAGGGTLTPEQLQACMDSGRVDPLTERLSNELLFIAAENEALGDGKPSPVSLYDNHKLHLQEHPSVGASMEARANPGIVQALQAHLAEHIRILRETDPVILAILGQQSIAPAPLPPGPGPQVPGAVPPKGAQAELGKQPNAARPPDMPGMPTNPQTKEKFAPAAGVSATPIQQ